MRCCPGATGRGSAAGRGASLESIGGCSRKQHNGRKPRFRFQTEKTLQDTWGEQPDIVTVKFSCEHKAGSRSSLHGGAWVLTQ